MNLTCPCCHAKFPLESVLDGAAAGELQLLLAQAGTLARPLLAYLGLFRSKTRALSFDRACRLASEVLELEADPRALGAALAEAVEAIRAKRDAGDVRPLKNHNYLRRVLENVPALPGEGLPALPARRASRTALADEVLDAWAGDDWLCRKVADGLKALNAMPLTCKPDPAAIDRTASLWVRELSRAHVAVEQVDAERVQRAFSGLLSAVKGQFPEPSAIHAYLPRRRELDALPSTGTSQQDFAAAERGLAEMRSRLRLPSSSEEP